MPLDDINNKINKHHILGPLFQKATSIFFCLLGSWTTLCFMITVQTAIPILIVVVQEFFNKLLIEWHLSIWASHLSIQTKNIIITWRILINWDGKEYPPVGILIVMWNCVIICIFEVTPSRGRTTVKHSIHKWERQATWRKSRVNCEQKYPFSSVC